MFNAHSRFQHLFFSPAYTYESLNIRAGMHFFAPISSSTHLAQSVHHTVTSWEKTPVDRHFPSGAFLSGGPWIFTCQQEEWLQEQSQDAEIQSGQQGHLPRQLLLHEFHSSPPPRWELERQRHLRSLTTGNNHILSLALALVQMAGGCFALQRVGETVKTTHGSCQTTSDKITRGRECNRRPCTP